VCVCVVYLALFSFRMAKQNTEDSRGIRNPLYLYFVEVNNKTLADSGFDWNIADSSGFDKESALGERILSL
jgi:hypothetical protein